jgi:hypothetical protein
MDNIDRGRIRATAEEVERKQRERRAVVMNPADMPGSFCKWGWCCRACIEAPAPTVRTACVQAHAGLQVAERDEQHTPLSRGSNATRTTAFVGRTFTAVWLPGWVGPAVLHRAHHTLLRQLRCDGGSRTWARDGLARRAVVHGTGRNPAESRLDCVVCREPASR